MIKITNKNDYKKIDVSNLPEYRCSHCGAKSQRHEGTGKPAPGNCPRRNKMPNGQPRPHVWVVNRKY